MGDGQWFGESELAGHPIFLSIYLRATLRNGDYSLFSGNSTPSVSLNLPFMSKQYGLLSHSLDVFTVQTAAPAGTANAYYQNVGVGGPFVASVYKPASGGASPYASLLDGFDLRDLGSVGNVDTEGRQDYVKTILNGPLGSVFFCPMGELDVLTDALGPVSFLSLRNNPVFRGSASIDLALPKPDRVKVAIYDIAGRLLKTIVDGPLDASTHAFTWAGTDERGRRVSPGVYLVRVSTAAGIRAAKTLVVLR